MTDKAEEGRKIEEQRKNAPAAGPYDWNAPGGQGRALPPGVAADGSAGSAEAPGEGRTRPPSFIPEAAATDPAARAARERNMQFYDPRFYYKTPGGYVRPGNQTGGTAPSMDKIHEAFEQAYFASFASPTTVGVDAKTAEAMRALRESFNGVRFPLWPGQPPARPVKDDTPRASHGMLMPQPQPKVQ